MDQWMPEEISAHVQYMREFAVRLEEIGEFVDTLWGFISRPVVLSSGFTPLVRTR